jgi:two-component system chemotaxis response regulator CheY
MAKILIVDDAPTVLNIEEIVLTSEGYEIDKAENAEEALSKIRDNKYDMGIFDVNMPGKNGLELTKEALSLPNGKNMKIVILTTESADELKAQAKTAGAKGWLIKPFKEEDLLAIVKKLIG